MYIVQVKLVGNIHGDEVVGRELLLGLAEGLCTGWADQREDVLRLLRSTEVHLLPSLNPDGFVLKTRNNANDRDLNRGFPDWADLGPTRFGLFQFNSVYIVYLTGLVRLRRTRCGSLRWKL